MKIVEFKNPKGLIEFGLVGAETWEDFDSLVGILKENVGVQPMDIVDGPDVRRCRIDYHGVTVILRYYDQLGNSLFSADTAPESVEQARSLAYAILKALQGS